MQRDWRGREEALSTINRGRLRGLCQRATPGPWRCRYVGGGRDAIVVRTAAAHAGVDIDRGEMEWATADGRPNAFADGEFIAAAREAIPQLLDENDRLRAELEVLRAAREEMGRQRDELRADLEKVTQAVKTHKADEPMGRE